jgi:ATP phosphoribosyltransferase
VSSGGTLFKNGFKEIRVLLRSEAVLAKSLKIEAEQGQLFVQLFFRMKVVLRAKNNKYILMNLSNSKIEQVSKILSDLKSPTFLPLAQEGWRSLLSVIVH